MRGALVAEAMSDDELPAEQPLEDVVTEELELPDELSFLAQELKKRLKQ